MTTTPANWDDLMVNLGLEPSNRPRRRHTAVTPAQCGTEAGCNRHYELAEKPCAPCLEAKRTRNRERDRARGVRERASYGSGCGTPAGAKLHRRRGEPICEPCREAKNAYQRKWNAAKRGVAA